MGRMHAPGKGISQSALPYRRSVPQWLKLTSDEVKDQIYKLAKKGLTPSQVRYTRRLLKNRSKQEMACYKLRVVSKLRRHFFGKRMQNELTSANNRLSFFIFSRHLSDKTSFLLVFS